MILLNKAFISAMDIFFSVRNIVDLTEKKARNKQEIISGRRLG